VVAEPATAEMQDIRSNISFEALFLPVNLLLLRSAIVVLFKKIKAQSLRYGGHTAR